MIEEGEGSCTRVCTVHQGFVLDTVHQALHQGCVPESVQCTGPPGSVCPLNTPIGTPNLDVLESRNEDEVDGTGSVSQVEQGPEGAEHACPAGSVNPLNHPLEMQILEILDSPAHEEYTDSTSDTSQDDLEAFQALCHF